MTLKVEEKQAVFNRKNELIMETWLNMQRMSLGLDACEVCMVFPVHLMLPVLLIATVLSSFNFTYHTICVIKILQFAESYCLYHVMHLP